MGCRTLEVHPTPLLTLQTPLRNLFLIFYLLGTHMSGSIKPVLFRLRSSYL